MQIQTNTDKNIEGHDRLAAYVEDVVSNGLDRFSSRITRVEVHLSDENSDKKGGQDMRCMMEARIEGRKPAAVTHQAETMDQAIAGALNKLKSSLDSTLDRMTDHRK